MAQWLWAPPAPQPEWYHEWAYSNQCLSCPQGHSSLSCLRVKVRLPPGQAEEYLDTGGGNMAAGPRKGFRPPACNPVAERQKYEPLLQRVGPVKICDCTKPLQLADEQILTVAFYKQINEAIKLVWAESRRDAEKGVIPVWLCQPRDSEFYRIWISYFWKSPEKHESNNKTCQNKVGRLNLHTYICIYI